MSRPKPHATDLVVGSVSSPIVKSSSSCAETIRSKSLVADKIAIARRGPMRRIFSPSGELRILPLSATRYRSGSGFERGKLARGGSIFRFGESGDVVRTLGTAECGCDWGAARELRLDADVAEDDEVGAMVNSGRLRPSFVASRSRCSL